MQCKAAITIGVGWDYISHLLTGKKVVVAVAAVVVVVVAAAVVV